MRDLGTGPAREERYVSEQKSGAQGKSKASNKPQAANPVGDILDEIGFVAAKGRHTCPKCKVRLPANAVLCVQCGYHLEKGKVLKTKRL